MAATVSKSSRPRNTPLLTKNGRPRLKLLTLDQLRVLFAKAVSKRAKAKVRNRILVLEKRLRWAPEKTPMLEGVVLA